MTCNKFKLQEITVDKSMDTIQLGRILDYLICNIFKTHERFNNTVCLGTIKDHSEQIVVSTDLEFLVHISKWYRSDGKHFTVPVKTMMTKYL